MLDAANAVNGRRLWLLGDKRHHAGAAWRGALADALRARGAIVEVHGVTDALAESARGLLAQGADAVQRLFGNSQGGVGPVWPDVVVVDSPAVMRAIGVLPAPDRLVRIGLVAGWDDAPSFAGARADAFVVPDASCAAALGPQARFVVAGPPWPPSWGVARDRDADREALAVLPGRLLVAVDAADASDAAIRELTALAVSVRDVIEFVFDYGANAAVAESLRRAALEVGLRARMVDGSDASIGAWNAADVGITIGESGRAATLLALGVPLVAITADAASWAPVVRDAVVHTRDVAGVGFVLRAIAAGGVDAGHRQAAAAFARRGGVEAVAEAIASLAAGVAAAAASTPRATPYEPIGQGAPEAPLTRDEARRRLAALILDERRIESEIGDLARERDKWLRRHELSSSQQATDLVEIARQNIDELQARIAAANQRLEATRRSRDELKRRYAATTGGTTSPAGGATNDDAEARFRELERRDDLERLKRSE